MRPVCRFLFLYTCLLYVSPATAQEKHSVKLDFSALPARPELFAEGVVTTNLYERDMALSPDGNELLYTIVSPQNIFSAIIDMKKDADGNWSKPEVASFSGVYSDLEPAFTPDGKKLFFVSNRPLSGDSVKDFDIWWVEKINGQWSRPVNIGAPVNTEANEFYPSVASNGNLYFTADYGKKGKGREDIYVTHWENGKYGDPVSLDTAVNSPLYEFNAFVSPDEQYIIFTSYGRSDDKGHGDLYISLKDAHNNWQPAKNLVLLNTDRLDYCPFVSFDKKILFFTSEYSGQQESYPGKPLTYHDLADQRNRVLNGLGNIYWISLDKALQSVR